METVTLLPVVAAGVAATIIGMVWYHPHVFGGIWARLVGVTPEMAERGKRRMLPYSLVALLASMLIAYVIAYIELAWQVADVAGALNVAFWCWAGFVVPVSLGSVLWEQRPLRLYMLNAAYWLIVFSVMSVVILY